MNDEHDAQRLFERRALRNVRALVEKIETEDRNRTADAVGHTLRIVPAILVGLAILALAVVTIRGKEQPRGPALTLPEYVERVFAKIEKRANTELRSDLDGLSGRVQVAFQVRPNGYIDTLEVRESSWNGVVDGQATRLVKLGEPFERIPANLASSSIDITATLRFEGGKGGRGSLSIDRKHAAVVK